MTKFNQIRDKVSELKKQELGISESESTNQEDNINTVTEPWEPTVTKEAFFKHALARLADGKMKLDSLESNAERAKRKRAATNSQSA